MSDLARLHVDTFRETHGGGPALSVRESLWQRILGANDEADFTFVVEEPEAEFHGAYGWPDLAELLKRCAH